MKNNIMEIDKLIKTIQENEYIDFSKNDIYESIMFYLNFCKCWFMLQQSDKLTNGISNNEPKVLFSESKESSE